jgi:hypothetical protein
VNAQLDETSRKQPAIAFEIDLRFIFAVPPLDRISLAPDLGFAGAWLREKIGLHRFIDLMGKSLTLDGIGDCGQRSANCQFALLRL